MRVRLFGLLLGSFAGFWFCAQLVSQAPFARDDWSFTAPWPLGWRALAAALGVAGYGILIRLTWWTAGPLAPARSDPRRFLAPHAAGALALVASAALRPGDGSALEMVLAVGVAPLGYVWAVTRPSLTGDATGAVAPSWLWTMAGLTGLAVYAAVFGRGVGPLA
jgi:hypothetical protein